ncbi:SPOR domain-containing protein [Pustulibacterium marinum]|nr:SPOR domain-containing protein [Pustulibacterium marinum]
MKKLYALSFLGLFSTQINYSQTENNNIEQPEVVAKLMELKTELGYDENIDKIYKIQIYSGGKANTEEASKEFIEKFPDWNFEINYEYPNYKLRAGKFRTRLEADKHLIAIKKEYPGALIINPKK